MPNLCHITLAGHLGRDAEIKTVGDQTVVEWSMAYTSKHKDTESTIWFKCAYWGQRAAKVAQYLTKGKAVLVIGGMTQRDYKGKDGTAKTSLEVRVESLTLLGGGEKRDGGDDGFKRQDKPASRPQADNDSEPPF
jgi:single-strand DNA-binding protein